MFHQGEVERSELTRKSVDSEHGLLEVGIQQIYWPSVGKKTGELENRLKQLESSVEVRAQLGTKRFSQPFPGVSFTPSDQRVFQALETKKQALIQAEESSSRCSAEEVDPLFRRLNAADSGRFLSFVNGATLEGRSRLYHRA